MSTDMNLFQFGDGNGGNHRLRVITSDPDGEPWFVAVDVCTMLGIANPRAATTALDDDEKGVATTDTPGGQQVITTVSESGLYSLILRSRRPEAKAIKRWVTHEVLPSIRRTGSYGTPAVSAPATLTFPEMLEQAAAQIRAAEARAITAEATVTEQAPKVEMVDTLLAANGDYAVRSAAAILTRDPTINIGQNQLFDYMRGVYEIGGAPVIRWVDGKGKPLRTALKNRWLAVKPGRSYPHPRTGEPTVGDGQTRVTPSGLLQLHELLGGARQLVIRDGDDEVSE